MALFVQAQIVNTVSPQGLQLQADLHRVLAACPQAVVLPFGEKVHTFSTVSLSPHPPIVGLLLLYGFLQSPEQY